MERKEIFEGRREIAKKLLWSLRSNGHLGAAAHFSSRPYCDGEKKYRFSMANYLRLAATTSHYAELHDPRWYTMEDISRNGWELRDRARPEKLEVWTKSPDGVQVCELVDFYHASDIADMEILPEKETSLADCLTTLERKELLKESSQVSLFEGVNAVRGFALHVGASELAASMATQMWLTESGVQANSNLQQGLYPEEFLTLIENNPDALFSAAHQAQEILKKLERVPQQGLAPLKDTPFSDLQVSFYWSEGRVKNLAGQEYPSDTILTGEAAYEFLVQFNSMDKNCFNEKIIGDHGYFKSGVAIRYKDYDHGDMRIDLGDLELGGCKSITEALSRRLDLYRQNLLQDDSAARRHWTELQREGQTEETFDEFLQSVRKESADFHAIMADLRQEENAYLTQHPELESINQQTANVFLYTVRAGDLEKVPFGIVMEKISDEIQPGHLLKETGFAVRDFVATYTKDATFAQSAKERAMQEQLAKEEVVTFASGWQPSDLEYRQRQGMIPPIFISISPEEQKQLHRLEDFRLELNHEAPLGLGGYMRSLEYSGFSALHILHGEMVNESREVDSAMEQRCSLRGESMDMSLYYQDTQIFHAAYEAGKQELFAAINKHGKLIPDELSESVATICKYLPYDSRPTELLREKQPILENFPTMEESRASYIKECRPELDPKDTYRAGNYYSIVTMLHPEVKSPEDFCRCMVEEMTKDGLTQNRMQRIVEQSKVNPALRQKMVELVQSPETKSAIRKAKMQAKVENAEAR